MPPSQGQIIGPQRRVAQRRQSGHLGRPAAQHLEPGAGGPRRVAQNVLQHKAAFAVSHSSMG